jgi:hypothetical protein
MDLGVEEVVRISKSVRFVSYAIFSQIYLNIVNHCKISGASTI